MDKLREYGRLFIAICVLACVVLFVVGVIEFSGLRFKWEAQADAARANRINAETEMIEERRQYLMLMPGTIAQLMDTLIASASTVVGWVFAVVLIALRVSESRNHNNHTTVVRRR